MTVLQSQQLRLSASKKVLQNQFSLQEIKTGNQSIFGKLLLQLKKNRIIAFNKFLMKKSYLM